MMRRPASARRGQPILALAVILVIWTVARAAMWNPIFAAGNEPAQSHAPVVMRGEVVALSRATVEPSTRLAGREEIKTIAWPKMKVPTAPLIDAAPPATREVGPPHRQSADLVADVPRFVPTATSLGGRAAYSKGQRWTFDQWLLMRAGSGVAATAPGAASYGASQAGAIARFRLGSGKPHDSFGYVRTSLAIDAPDNDRELAVGLGLRPMRRVPLRVMAEVRVYDSSNSQMRLRPVVTVVTELPWQNLPAGFLAEVYGQAGYAGGVGPTAFFDAQAVVDRSVTDVVGVKREVRLGAGVWAGGQKGAVRLDVGPRVTLPLDLGDGVASRIALDWRLRVAGNANPASGPALTVASSF